MLVLTSPPFINEELGAQTVKTLAQGHMASRSRDLNPGRLALQVTRSTTELQGLPSLALGEPQVSSAFTPLTPPRILSPVYRALLGALSGPCLGRPSLQASLCVLLSPGLSNVAAPGGPGWKSSSPSSVSFPSSDVLFSREQFSPCEVDSTPPFCLC